MNHLVAFAIVSIALAVVPGPAVIYIATRSATQGRLAGVVSVLGVATGGLVHVAGAAAGLSVVLMRSAVAMQYIRLAGAAYLIYLGIQKLRSASTAIGDDVVRRQPFAKIYRDGVVVNVLNPKTALFFLSFLPQFVEPARGHVPSQLMFLGCTFVALAFITDSLYALGASTIANAAKSASPRASRAASLSSGVIYIGLGVASLATKERHS